MITNFKRTKLSELNKLKKLEQTPDRFTSNILQFVDGKGVVRSNCTKFVG